MAGINIGGSKIVLKLAGINFVGSQKKSFFGGNYFGGFARFSANPPNPPKSVPAKSSSFKVVFFVIKDCCSC